MKNVLVIAGEKSGEEHFLTLYREILRECNEIKFFGVGGDEMKALGIKCLYDIDSFSTMGFSEVVLRLPFYFRAMKTIINEVEAKQCKYAILIDFQD